MHFPDDLTLFSDSTFQSLLLTHGELLACSTVAATYEDKLLVGALLDPGVLLCHDLH